MLPKQKLNESSLNNLNSVNMMINYNNSNCLTSNNQAKLQQQDERFNCRALICDSNGIIIGETAYRCMICSQISDSIAEIKQHYYDNHSNEFLLGPNLNNSLSNLQATNGNFLTNSILNNSLNNGMALQLTNTLNNLQQNSNSLLNNNLNDKLFKKKNIDNLVDKLKNIKNSNIKQQRNQTINLIQQQQQSTGNDYFNQAKERNLLNYNLSQQLNNQNFNNNNQDDYDDLDDDQKSELDDDWYGLRNNQLTATDLINNNAILDAFNINKSNLFKFKYNDNLNEQRDSIKSNKSNSNNIFENSLETDYSNSNIYENMMNLTDETNNSKDDILRNLPPVKLKRGSTTANVGKPGHVSCAVCGVVRYYSCVYRRYGQFTCQVCYRFFRTFFVKPHRYTCTNLGSCPLDVRVRCRACWIQACINLYTVDGQRKQILDTYRPLNKSADDEITDKNNNCTNVSDKNNSTLKAIRQHTDDDDELSNSRNSKKMKKNFNDQQQYSNGDDVEEEEEEYDLSSKQDDEQDEPLNYTNKKNDLSEETELKDE